MYLPCYYPNAIANAVASFAASVALVAPISLNSSLALLPSIVVPSTLKKSLSATPEPNCATFVFDIPVDKVAVAVIAVPFNVIASASRVPSK